MIRQIDLGGRSIEIDIHIHPFQPGFSSLIQLILVSARSPSSGLGLFLLDDLASSRNLHVISQ